ncbi:MAG: TonB-dependent receptor [Desulfatiglandaceae bacterium]
MAGTYPERDSWKEMVIIKEVMTVHFQRGLTAGFVFLAVYVFATGLPADAWAQDRDTGIYTLGEVVVTAKKGEAESVGTVREVTAGEIEASGARTLSDAVKLLPGVQVRVGPRGQSFLDIRGFRPRHVLLLLDGIPFNSTYDGQFDASTVPVENIAKIKVSYGTHSVLYDQGGLGGVINIITKKGTQGLHGQASGEAADRGTGLGRASISGGKDGMDFFLSGSSLRSDGYRMSNKFDPTSEEDGGLRENSDRRQKNLFANMGFSPNDQFRLGAVFNYSSGEYGIPSSVINDKNDPFAQKPKYDRIDGYNQASFQVSGRYDLPGPVELRSWFYVNRMSQLENQYDDSSYTTQTRKGSFHEKTENAIKGLTVQGKVDLKSAGVLTVGLNGRRDDWNVGGWTAVNTNSFESIDQQEDVEYYSTALQYEVSPLQKTGLVVGCNYHWFKKDGNEEDSHPSFMLGVHYDPLQGTRIRASAARTIRFPSVQQLYDPQSGNPDLTTEKSDNYEIGIDQELPFKSKVSLTGFLSDVRNYIEKDDATNLYENNQRYRFKGIEVGLENRFIEALYLKVGYTYMQTKDLSAGTEVDQLQYRPRDKVTFEARYRFPFDLSVYADMLYVANQYYYSKNAPLMKRKLDDFTLFNVKLKQGLLNDRMSLYLGANNLFDQNYEESYGFPRAGRTVYGGVEVRF